MNKIQKVRFRNLGDLLDYLPEIERELILELRDIILEEIPDVREHMAYNVPFYSRHRRICYLWPSSVPWGGLKPGDGVALGFSEGTRLRHGGYLEEGLRKQVASKTFSSQKEIDRSLIASLLSEAILIDAQRF